MVWYPIYWFNIQLYSCHHRTIDLTSDFAVIDIGLCHTNSNKKCSTLANVMFAFVKFDVELSTCVPNPPIIMGLPG